MRTPSEPTYWHGNLIVLKDLSSDPLAQAALFEADFPQATHRTIVWDLPDLDPDPLAKALTRVGFDVETFDVLALTEKMPVAECPVGMNLRPLESDADWLAVLSLQAEVGAEEGYDAAIHTPFLQRRNTTRRAQIAAGMGAWFGAFDGDLIVGSMGMFHDEKIARYQSVETRKSHRRKGICAALLTHSCQWALARAPYARPVIVAQADSEAGRLYRRMGFDLAETLVEATKPGY